VLLKDLRRDLFSVQGGADPSTKHMVYFNEWGDLDDSPVSYHITEVSARTYLHRAPTTGHGWLACWQCMQVDAALVVRGVPGCGHRCTSALCASVFCGSLTLRWPRGCTARGPLLDGSLARGCGRRHLLNGDAGMTDCCQKRPSKEAKETY